MCGTLEVLVWCEVFLVDGVQVYCDGLYIVKVWVYVVVFFLVWCKEMM